MVKEILIYPDQVLLNKSDEVTEFGEELASLVQDLKDTAASPPWGRALGLAAPQIGVNKRVFIVTEGDHKVFVNPVIQHTSEQQNDELEGCFSCEAEKTYPVKRYQSIWLKAQDEKGNPLELRLNGIQAQVIQHELDHLNGYCVLDYQPYVEEPQVQKV